jgi:hypothetical protein
MDDVAVVLVSDADSDGFGDTGSDAPKVNDDTLDVVNEDDKNDNKDILEEEKNIDNNEIMTEESNKIMNEENNNDNKEIIEEETIIEEDCRNIIPTVCLPQSLSVQRREDRNIVILCAIAVSLCNFNNHNLYLTVLPV